MRWPPPSRVTRHEKELALSDEPISNRSDEESISNKQAITVSYTPWQNPTSPFHSVRDSCRGW